MSSEIVAISMFVIMIIFLFLGVPLAFALGGVGVLFGYIFMGSKFFGVFIDRIYGTMDNFLLVAVTLFILMGNFLTISGVADNLFKSLRYLFGPLRGGLGLAVISICIIFAACTGIIGASVVTMGLLAGPMLIRYGYQKEMAMGMIAAGGSLGVLIPPSIMMVIMGDQAALSVGKLLMAGAIPGISLGILYMIYITVRCWINPSLGPAVPRTELVQFTVSRRIRDSVIYALPPGALVFAVLGSIFFGVATPTEAAGVGTFAAFILMLAYKKFKWQTFKRCIYQTGRSVTMVFIILIGASSFTAAFLGTGSGTTLVTAIMGLGLGKWGLYFLMMGILIILGMFIDWIAIVMIVFPIFLPIAKALNFDMIWFVTMMAVNLQMSFLSPPFGYALFYLSGLNLQGVTLQHIYRGVVPFLIIQFIGLIICTFIPELSLWLPNLMIGK